ncbi:stromal membrane-associated protein 2 [Esox lucius]|uniref:Arf-GAP domain-containing protein n=1 Tax=Esox lucius TaxID=8010 RepID=A0A3P8YKY5_ESOLU|nr:stromal membrane-associated protein 2 [Esox lucius]
MMSGKSMKDIDRYQAALNSLLSLEENKFCADCESKGPRWASWSLGVFICIRCAGIHRNLGVHISRVKSVNLDQWTQEQIQCVQEMGNAKAKRLYEAFLPECFSRPETDQSAEIFIRDKYEKKKYMDKVLDVNRLRKEKSCENIPREPVVFEKMKLKRENSPKTQTQSHTHTKTQTQGQAVSDLLGLDVPVSGAAVTNGRPCRGGGGSPSVSNSGLDLFSSASSSTATNTPVGSSMPRGRVAASVPENLSLFLDSKPRQEGSVRKLSKDSILSLYATTPTSHPNLAAHAGLYMNPAQLGYYGSYHSLANQGGALGGTMVTSHSMMSLSGHQQNTMMRGQQQSIMGAQQNGPQQNIFLAQQGVTSPFMAGVPHGVIQQQSFMGAQPNGMVAAQQNGFMGYQHSIMGGQQQSIMGAQQNGLVATAQNSFTGQGQPQQSIMGQQQCTMGQQQGIMGVQQQGMLGGMPAEQQLYAAQQGQQLQWNIAQMTQHMAGLNSYGANGKMGYDRQHMGGPTNQSTTQMMTSNIWK